jgi:hypothetical protein
VNAAAPARLRALAAQAGVGVLLDVGARAGLIDAFTTTCTADELAARCAVDVAIARDWLNGMVLASLADHDGRRDTYALLPETRAALALLQAPPHTDGALAASALGPAPLVALRALRASMKAGDALAIVELRSADCLADNAAHPLGPAVYAASLRRRAAGEAGVLGEHQLRALMTAAGLRDVEVTAVGPFHIVVRGVV